MIADLFFDPRVADVDRAGLGNLFAGRVLRDASPAQLRRQRVRELYRAARADGLNAPQAEEEVAARLRVTTDFVHNAVNRGKSRRKSRRCAGVGSGAD
jgi:hypothetical protein